MVDGPVVVTGGAGFAGSHLIDLLGKEGMPLVAWTRPGGQRPRSEQPGIRWMEVDLLDRRAIQAAIEVVRPAAIYHCAGSAHVGQSWDNCQAPFSLNVLGTHYIIEAARQARLVCRILIPGSATVYRSSVAAISEEAPLAPASPYGLSKLAQEMLGARSVTDDGLAVLLPRAFNHLGPRQDPSFVGSSFARQIALIEAGLADPAIDAGNLGARRDMTDVRDTVRAYRALMDRGRPGVPYNVCSGRAYVIGDLLEKLLAQARVRVTIRNDPSRYRPHDTPVVLGDSRRIHEEIGWRPQIPIEQTLSDLLDYWRAEVAVDSSQLRVES